MALPMHQVAGIIDQRHHLPGEDGSGWTPVLLGALQDFSTVPLENCFWLFLIKLNKHHFMTQKFHLLKRNENTCP